MVTKNTLLELVKSYDREGTWAKLEALFIEAISIDGFYNARRNIEIRYGTNEPIEKYNIYSEILQEMISVGLVYECYWSSRKHSYYHLIVPPFAKEVWLKLPDIIPLPTINVEERW